MRLNFGKSEGPIALHQCQLGYGGATVGVVPWLPDEKTGTPLELLAVFIAPYLAPCTLPCTLHLALHLALLLDTIGTIDCYNQ